MTQAGPGLPSFLPGLLIVSLLIIASILVGWKNFLRRGRPRSTPRTPGGGGGGDAPFRNETGGPGGLSESGSKPEKPQLWEVGIAARRIHGHDVYDDDDDDDDGEWEKIMPLSATSFAAEPALPKFYANSSELSHTPTTPSSTVSNSRSSLVNLRPASVTKPPPPPPPPAQLLLPPPPPRKLQVSVLISMPSSHYPRCRRRQPADDAAAAAAAANEKVPHNDDDGGLAVHSLAPATPPRQRQQQQHRPSQSRVETTAGVDIGQVVVVEGSPEVALGVTVLPWRREASEEN